jgi:polysaccharide deacetylase 2 family uncharacterized protein YibQ
MARKSRRSRGGGFWLFLLGLVIGVGTLYLVYRDVSPDGDRRDGTVESASASLSGEKPPVLPNAKPASAISEYADAPDDVPANPPAEGSEGQEGAVQDDDTRLPGHVALVIDDLGGRMEDLQPLTGLGVPITYAVLPYEEQTQPVLAELRRRKAEIILHLPMQPKNSEDPGPGALVTGMSDDELRDGTEAALRAVPGVVGVNNHMGSRMSEDTRSMTTVLEVISKRGLFFLDSRTSAGSIGYRTARSLGIPAAERQVFLDRDPDPEAIRTQFRRLLDLSRERGAAVAIGHPLPETLQVLTEEVPKARAEGYSFVPVSYLLDRSEGADDSGGGADDSGGAGDQ